MSTNKKLLNLILFITIAFSQSLSAAESSGFYLGSGISNLELMKKNASKNKDTFHIKNHAKIFIGYNLNEFFAIETEANYGLPVINTNAIKPNKYMYYDAWLNLVPQYTYLDSTFFIKVGSGFSHFKTQNIIENQKTNEVSNNIKYKVGAGYEHNLGSNSSIGIEYSFISTIQDNPKTFRGNLIKAKKKSDSLLSIYYKYSF